MRLKMEPYNSEHGDAGVIAFAIGSDFIDVQFKNGHIYRYNKDLPGKEKVERMKELAKKGTGLTTYINQFVRESYAEQLT